MAKKIKMTYPLSSLAESYKRHLRAEHVKETTIHNYDFTFAHLATWLTENQKTDDVASITTDDMRDHLVWLQDRLQPTTVQSRFKQLRAFFAWCVEEEILSRSPMTKIKMPAAAEVEKDILSDEEIKLLFDTCKDKHSYNDVRDLAIMRLLLDSGLRANECASIKLEDMHMEGKEQLIVVPFGKGDKYRIVGFGAKTATSIDRYLRFRAQHVYTEQPWLFLGQKGKMTGFGLIHIMEKRCTLANISHATPHSWRHTFIDRMKRSGISDENIMSLTGHSSTQVFQHYAKKLRSERALDAYQGNAPGDHI